MHLGQPIQTVGHIHSCTSKHCGCNSSYRSTISADWLTDQFSSSFIFSWTSALCELQALHSKNICLQ